MKFIHIRDHIHIICCIIIFSTHCTLNLQSVDSPEVTIITTQVTSIEKRLEFVEAKLEALKNSLPTHNTVMPDTASTWREWRIKWSERGKHTCYFITLCACLDCCGQLKI